MDEEVTYTMTNAGRIVVALMNEFADLSFYEAVALVHELYDDVTFLIGSQ